MPRAVAGCAAGRSPRPAADGAETARRPLPVAGRAVVTLPGVAAGVIAGVVVRRSSGVRGRAPAPRVAVARRAARRPVAVLLALAGLACLLAGARWAAELRGGADVGVIGAGRPVGPPSAGTVPVALELPARRVTAPVVSVATGRDGGLAVPEPPSTVGWWAPSALPGGSAGTTVVAGHVDTRAGGIGALAVLRRVTVGEPVLLRGTDGRVVAYRVVARRHHAKADLPPEIFAVGGPPRLVLVTCGGRFDEVTRHYTDNVVVYAEPV